MIDNIGRNMAEARSYVEDGVEELVQAKNMVMIGIVLLIIVVVLALGFES
jgi:hypothetical protein